MVVYLVFLYVSIYVYAEAVSVKLSELTLDLITGVKLSEVSF